MESIFLGLLLIVILCIIIILNKKTKEHFDEKYDCDFDNVEVITIQDFEIESTTNPNFDTSNAGNNENFIICTNSIEGEKWDLKSYNNNKEKKLFEFQYDLFDNNNISNYPHRAIKGNYKLGHTTEIKICSLLKIRELYEQYPGDDPLKRPSFDNEFDNSDSSSLKFLIVMKNTNNIFKLKFNNEEIHPQNEMSNFIEHPDHENISHYYYNILPYLDFTPPPDITSTEPNPSPSPDITSTNYQTTEPNPSPSPDITTTSEPNPSPSPDITTTSEPNPSPSPDITPTNYQTTSEPNPSPSPDITPINYQTRSEPNPSPSPDITHTSEPNPSPSHISETNNLVNPSPVITQANIDEPHNHVNHRHDQHQRNNLQNLHSYENFLKLFQKYGNDKTTTRSTTDGSIQQTITQTGDGDGTYSIVAPILDF